MPIINLDRWTVDECYDFSEGMAITRAFAFTNTPTTYGWSYITKDGKPLPSINSENLGCFSDGLAMVQHEKLCGYIDKQGRYAIPPQFEEAHDFSDGLAAVKVGGKWGYINHEGKLTIKPQFDAAQGFSNGLAGISQYGRMGYIDAAGKIVIPPVYEKVYPFSEGVGLGCLSNSVAGGDNAHDSASNSARMRQIYLDRTGKVLFAYAVSPGALSGLGGGDVRSSPETRIPWFDETSSCAVSHIQQALSWLTHLLPKVWRWFRSGRSTAI